MPKDSEKTFLGEAVRGVKNATYLAKKALEGKVSGGPMSPFGPYKTRDEQLAAQQSTFDRQTTDSNNR